ncbi:MAG TPA: glycosyltransferase family 39 protein [Patescibacteria group bacterium]|nr:glycosyltransferase family 39 protein [Patescibacteria group bacterium]
MINKLKQLERSHHFWFALGISFVFFLLRLPSLFEPYWYGDEGIYETLGLALDRGRTLYTQIWDNKPPLLYYTYAVVGGNQYLVRLLSLAVGIGSVLIFFALCQKLFNRKRKPTFIATISFAFLFGLPIIEGNIANAENFMLLPIIIAAYLIYCFVTEKEHLSVLVVAGLLLGVAFLYKIVGMFDFAAMLVVVAISLLPESLSLESIKQFIVLEWKTFALFLVGFITPFLLSIIYFTLKGGLGTYIQAIFLSNVGYVGYKNVFIIPQGLLISKLILLGLAVIFLLIKRKKLTSPGLFIFSWICFSLFNSFFSQRPYTHYLLVLIPSFCLLVGYVFWQKNSQRFLSIIVTGTTFLLTVLFFGHWSPAKTFNYYTNFVHFASGQKSLSAYESFFDSRVPSTMELVRYLNSHGKENKTLFVWGNSAQIYYLTGTLPPGRFTVAYHISGIKKYEQETAQALKKSPPDFTVIFHDAPPFSFSVGNMRQVLTTTDATIYERID